MNRIEGELSSYLMFFMFLFILFSGPSYNQYYVYIK